MFTDHWVHVPPKPAHTVLFSINGAFMLVTVPLPYALMHPHTSQMLAFELCAASKPDGPSPL